jgi:hypothetical protein
MRNQRSRSVAQIVYRLASALFLAAALADAGAAMQGRRPTGNPDLKRDQREREQREAALRTTSEAPSVVAKLDQKRVEAAVKQLKEDFKQIQVVRNEIARNILAGRLDYKIVLSETEDINKRAGRLKSYLIPPTPNEKEQAPKNQVEFNGQEMKDALIRLCILIDSFVDNPVLKAPDTTDVEQSFKAGGDLLSIIELSGNIKRSAERLNKTPR